MERVRGLAIDSHIHFGQYKHEIQAAILDNLSTNKIQRLIGVSTNSKSALEILKLSRLHPEIAPTIGYHPEQQLPTNLERNKIFQLIDTYATEWKAIGEVGLPYYSQINNPAFNLNPYIQLLEEFIIVAKQKQLPICLHVVYEHSYIAYELLKKHNVNDAHFHWYKADFEASQMIIESGYMISFTPDILFKEKRKSLIKQTPLTQIMVETDGPWKYPEITNKVYTDPSLIHFILLEIAKIKKLPLQFVYEVIFNNTKNFYNI